MTHAGRERGREGEANRALLVERPIEKERNAVKCAESREREQHVQDKREREK